VGTASRARGVGGGLRRCRGRMVLAAAASGLLSAAVMAAPAGARARTAPVPGCGVSSLDVLDPTTVSRVSLHGPVDFEVGVVTCESGDVSASAGGAATRLGSINPAPIPVITVTPCSLAGGKDLPGSTVTFSTNAADPQFRGPVAMTLGDDTTKPELKVHSTPAKGTKVKPGDKIAISAAANESRAGGYRSWQTGIRSIQVTALNAGGLIDSKDYGSTPKPCGQKNWNETLQAKPYKVPANPPAVIHLQAVTEDYQGNQGTLSADFPTGDQWTGKIGGQEHSPYCTDTLISGSLSLTVAKDGAVTGTGHTTTTDATCHYPDGKTASTQGGPADMTITGQKTKKAFTLQIVWGGYSLPTFTAPIHGSSAAGEATLGLTAGGVQTTFSLTCQTCGK
jgi:hypothetical protein